MLRGIGFAVCLCVLGGCSKIPVQNTEGATITSTTTVEQITSGLEQTVEVKKGYFFEHKGLEIVIDTEAASVLEALGETKSYFEAASCAIDGMIRTYGYNSFELDTYEQDGKEYISCIYFKDDTITTKEGAYLFMTKEQLLNIYGEDYTIEAGMFVYSKDEMKLKFILTDDIVTSIQYTSLVTEVKQ